MTQVMQTGGAQPLNKTWELSLYDLQRTPQEAITDSLEVAVSPHSLHSELMCPICLDMLKNTMTTKECLHRFCAECIITSLHSGNKECPTCRKKLVSKRSLRQDPYFDALISKIYPSRDEYEAYQEQVLTDINKGNNQQRLLMQSGIRWPQRGKKQQLENNRGTEDSDGSGHHGVNSFCGNASGHSTGQARPSMNCMKALDGPGQDVDTTAEGMSDVLGVDGASEIELVFRPHPTLMEKDGVVQTRYIKTSRNATVDHLSKYLALRLSLEELPQSREGSATTVRLTSEKQYTIYILTSGSQFTVLNGSFSLELVSEKYWKVNKPMELYFA